MSEGAALACGGLAAAFAAGLAFGVALGPITAGLASYSVSTTPSSGLAGSKPENEAHDAPIRTAYRVEVLRVLDGDTFEARVNLWPGLAVTTRVRLRGIDAPELKARCGEERAKAESALTTLQTILDEGEVAISAVSLDKYGGRVLADASTRATPNVSSVLLRVGAVRQYSGGRREGWCG